MYFFPFRYQILANEKTNVQTRPPLYTGSTTEKRLPYSYPYGYILVSTYLHPCIRTDTKMQIRRCKDADT